MRRVNTSQLQPGMVTAEDVYSLDDQLIIPKGLILDLKTIEKLGYYSILAVRVEDEVAEVAPEPHYTYTERIRETPEFQQFQAEFEEDVDNFKSMINDVIVKGSPLNMDDLMHETLSVLDVSQTTGNMLDMLHCMRDYDDATYAHCINVALICNVLARWLRLSEEDIKLATVSGLLHDIGKTRIPDEIIKKPGKLTAAEYKLVQKHPYLGYQMLKDSTLDPLILNAVLMHHERCDGTGYPMGLHGNHISTYARLVSIADVYDAMTSARVYRDALCPFRTIEIFEDEGLQKYDPQYILIFLENVVNTYLLNDVILTNGDKGTIVYINKNKLSSPTVKTASKFVDLSKETGIKIEALL